MSKINIEDIKRTLSLMSQAKSDKLRMFVMAKDIDDLVVIREQNLQILFDEAKKYGVRYLYVGKGEISGCEDKKQTRDGGWPAMWAIAKNIGFPGSCGNKDQYQCYDSEVVFPENSYGGWDLETNTKLSDEETEKMKFNRVVTRPHARSPAGAW